MRHAHAPRHHHRCGPGRGELVFPGMLAMAGGRHGGWGFGPGPGRDPFFPGGRGGGPRRGRSRRGDVRAAILLLLEEQPRNGYGLMQEVEERSDGAWRPSPGSIYPALAQLEDEGLIAPAEGEQGKAFTLTDAGREYVEEHRERLGSPWDAASQGVPEGVADLRSAIGLLATASVQAAQTGDKAVLEATRKILDDARKAIYRLLAGDDEDSTD